MGTATLYPDNVFFGEYGFGIDAAGRTLVGSATDWGALDSSDSSYWQSVAGAGGVAAGYVHFPNPSLPAGARITAIRVTLRQSNTAGNSYFLVQKVGHRNPTTGVKTMKTFWIPAGSPNPYIPTDGIFYDWVTTYITMADNGQTWDKITPTGTDFVVLFMTYLKFYPPGFDANAKASMLRLEIDYNEKPVVTVTSPSGTIFNTRPTINWTVTDPENDPQVRKWIAVYDSATYSLPGFTPFKPFSPAAYFSGPIASSIPSQTIDKHLINGVTYKAYVWVFQSDVNGESFHSDAAASATFTVTLDPPAPPDIVALLDYPNGRVALALQDRQNLLTSNAADIETSSVGWITTTNATSSRITSTFAHATASLQIQSSAAGNASASTPQGSAGFAVAGSKQYTAMAQVRRISATARNCRLDLNWYDSGGALISTSSSASTSVNTTDWSQQLSVTATSPSNAAFVAVVLVVLSTAAAGEQFAFDMIGIRPGNSATWYQGGYNTVNETLEVERSLDAGVTWTAIRQSQYVDPPVDQAVNLYDYEVPPYTAVQYRVRSTNVVSGNNMTSVWTTSGTVNYRPSDWWLKDPIDTTRNLAVKIKEVKIGYPKPNVKDFPIGQNTTNMSHDGVKGAVVDTVIYSMSGADYADLDLLLRSGRTLLLQDVLGRQWYVQPDDGFQWTMQRAVKLPGEVTPVRHIHEMAVTFIEVPAP